MAHKEPSDEQSLLPFSVIDYLSQIQPVEVSPAERTKIAERCHDADDIPKVKDAGKVIRQDGKQCQIMFNGVKVLADGYYGSWQTDLIKKLKGHHEPQEEKAFYELSKHFRPGTAMIELGSYWSFYSLWFNKVVSNAFNICCEPDPKNRKVGQTNFEINGFKNAVFVEAAAGSDNHKYINFDNGPGSQKVNVPIRTVDSLVDEHKIKQLEVLHMDVQGAEYEALKGAAETIKAGKLRFIFISTHHFIISRDPDIHRHCIELIKKLGGHIIGEHDIHESFSGDGLIVASFDNKDKNLSIEFSRNRLATAQFRPYMQDMALVFAAYDAQLDRLVQKRRLEHQVNDLTSQVTKLEESINYLTKLGIKGSSIRLLKSIYQSLKFRTAKLIWGSAGYKDSEALRSIKDTHINDKAAALSSLKIINNSDKANISLVARDSRARSFIYENMRKAEVKLRQTVTKPRKPDNV